MEQQLFNRKYRLIMIIILSLFLSDLELLSQHLIDPYIEQLSPQTYDFIKYGKTDIGYYTGEINLTVPVYTYKDNDFEIPIYLGYNSSGFMPNRQEGIVGLNWFLNAGGVITRKINGSPDDSNGPPYSTGSLNGTYYGVKNEPLYTTTSKDSIFKFSNCGQVTPTTFYWNIGGYEVEPDEFNFSMPGYSGSFFIGNNGDVKCTGNLPYKIDLTNFAIQEYNSTSFYSSGIKIITDDGYEYYFGGDIQFLEVSYPLTSTGNCPGIYHGDIIAWHLNKIKAPNGRVVTFSYLPFVPGYDASKGRPNDNEHYLLNYYMVFNKSYDSVSRSGDDLFNFISSGNYGGTSGPQEIYETTKTAYLTEIAVDQTKIKFLYNAKRKKFYYCSSKWNQYNLSLDTITVDNNNYPGFHREYVLNHEYLGGTFGKRMFLTSFTESGMGSYNFFYYNTASIPSPKTSGIDYWGFWKGGYDSTGYLIPSIGGNIITGSFEYTSGEREPDPIKGKTGLLEKVTYPTGGNTSFFYEGHTYSKRLERRIENGFLPALQTVSDSAGGVRISKIVDNDGSNNQNCRLFRYVKDNPNGLISSGILLDWPRYVFNWKYNDNGKLEKHSKQRGTSLMSNSYPDEKYIHYSEVYEVTLPDSGYTQYKFTNYETHPDVNDIKVKELFPAYTNNIVPKELHNNLVGMKSNNASFERGILYETNIFKNVNGTYIPVRKEKIDTACFSGLDDFPDNYSVGVIHSGYIAQSYKLYSYPFLPKRKIITSYSDNGSITTVTVDSLVYNRCNQLIEYRTNSSNKSFSIKKFKYVTDYIPANFNESNINYHDEGIIYKLFQRNNIKPLIETIQLENNLIVSGEITKYDVYPYVDDFGSITNNHRVLPSKKYVLETSTPIDPMGFEESKIVNCTSLSKDANYKLRTSYDNYDSFQNLLQYHMLNDIYISCLWGYNKPYPIAIAKNAKKDEIGYASFEVANENLNGWTYVSGTRSAGYAKTGIYSFTNAQIKITPSKRSILSLWAKVLNSSPSIEGYAPSITYTDISGLTYFEWNVEPEVLTLNSNSSYIDDIRLYPAGATMTTYTYTPLIGMTSKTDESGVSTYYEYDSYGRLKSIKDDHKKIVEDYSINIQKGYSTITTNVFGNGTISPLGSTAVLNGLDFAYTIIPDEGYDVAKILIDGEQAFLDEKLIGGEGASGSLSCILQNVQSDHRIQVYFKVKTFTISVVKVGNGTVNPSGNSTVNYKSNLKYTFSPDAGYHIKDVKVDDVSVGAPDSYTFNEILANHTISVEFAINTYTITATTTGLGTTTPNGDIIVNYGSDTTYTYIPASGYHVAKIVVDSLLVGFQNSYTFSNIQKNHTLSVEFDTIITIYATKTGNGTMTPSGNSVVNNNSDTTYTFTPATGYVIKNVIVDGTSVGALGSYTFGNIQSYHTISVEFEQIYLNLSDSSVWFSNTVETKTVQVLSNVSWTISHTGTFKVTGIPTPGHGPATINVSCYATSQIRTGTITVSGGGITKTINIYQNEDLYME